MKLHSFCHKKLDLNEIFNDTLFNLHYDPNKIMTYKADFVAVDHNNNNHIS